MTAIEAAADARGTPLDVAPNVFLDGASAHAWEALNEHVFVRRVLDALRDELGTAFADLSFFIFSPHRADARPASADLHGPNKVLIFLSDESSSVPVALAGHYRAIFKAYLPRDLPGSNIFAFNLGYVGDAPPPPPVPVLDRPVDIFFSGNLNANRGPLYQACHPWLRPLPAVPPGLVRLAQRWPLKRMIRRDFGTEGPGLRTHIRFTDGFKAGLGPRDYWAMLARSRIVLCPRGFASAETFRHVEALRAGAIVVSEALPDTVLYRDSPIVRVDGWRRGLDAARWLAADPAALVDLQAQSMAWYDTHLSERATARAMAAAITGAGLSAARRLLYDPGTRPRETNPNGA